MIRIIFSILLVSCMNTEDTALVKGGGASDQQAVWFRSPEVIKETIIKTLCINLGVSKENGKNKVSDYIYTIGTMYGNPDMGNMRTPLEKPDGAYLLALDIVSMWLSRELLLKQYIVQENYRDNKDSDCAENPKDSKNNRYLFNGTRYTRHAIRDADTCASCYSDSSRAWCDCKDDVYLGQFSKEMSLNQAQRKRIMHNIQDISDFLGVPIDNELRSNDGRHVPSMLLDDVFIPALAAKDCSIDELFGRVSDDVRVSMEDTGDAEGEEVDFSEEEMGEQDQQASICTDFIAWQQVVHALLMSGPFYMKLETVER